MSDEFLKIIKQVQQTGQASQALESDNIDKSSSTITVNESIDHDKFYRFVADSKPDKSNNQNNNDD